MAIFQSFDPTSMSKKDLRDIFVAREKLLKDALKRIKESGAGKSKKHLLLVGPRGSGKTYFQLLIYYEVNENLSDKWLALKFPEEEYSITSLADLLLSILLKMGQEEIYEAEKLREKLCICDDDIIEEDAINFIKKFHAETGKNILLLLENFQDLAVQLDTKGVHKLKVFIKENDFLMLFPSSLSAFRQVVDYGEPFYDFFDQIQLKKIKIKDTEELLIKLAEWENRSDFANTLKKKNERIKGIYNLTGGNVRLIVLIYHIISHDPMDYSHKALEEVETALHNLLNELTPYYQYQMNVLSIQQRKILDSMALYEEGAIQPKELAKFTRIDPRVISHQLKLLKDLGYVKSRQKGRTAKYEVTERLFRIWRETRIQKGKTARINFLTQFFKYYYKPVELWEMYKKYKITLELKPIKSDLKTVQKYHEYLSHIVNTKKFKGTLITEQVKKIAELVKKDEFEKALFYTNQALEIDSGIPYIWFIKGVLLAQLSYYEKSVDVFKQGLQLDPKDANAWDETGIVLSSLGRHQEALDTFEQAIQLEPKNPDIWFNKGLTLKELKKFEEALIAFEQVIRLEPKNSAGWNNKGLVLNSIGRNKEALTVLDQVIQIEPNNSLSWYNKGKILQELGHYEDAISAFNKAIKIEPEFINSWLMKGDILGTLGRYEEALNAFKKGILLNPKDAASWRGKGQALISLGCHEKALVALEKAFELNSEYSKDDIILFLRLSARAANSENLGIAFKAFSRGMECINNFPDKEEQSKEKHYNESIVLYFSVLFVKPKIEFIERTLKQTVSAFPQMKQLLKPYSRALEYLKNKDDDSLNNLHPEERAVIKDILGMEGEE
jgi:tetratricopeptide (TPR) repeat protein